MNRHVLIEKKGFYHILKILIIHCFPPLLLRVPMSHIV